MNREVKQALHTTWRQADRLMVLILWAMLLVALALSNLHGTLAWALLIGIPAALVPTVLAITAGGTRLTRMTVAFALIVMCALHIHQAAGMTETHFGIFVLLAFLLCYRDYVVILAAAGAIAVHHLSFNYLQELGFGVRCLTETGIGPVPPRALGILAGDESDSALRPRLGCTASGRHGGVGHEGVRFRWSGGFSRPVRETLHKLVAGGTGGQPRRGNFAGHGGVTRVSSRASVLVLVGSSSVCSRRFRLTSGWSTV